MSAQNHLTTCEVEVRLVLRSAIEKLRSDNLKLKQELVLENRFSVQPSTANAAALIKSLKDQGDALLEQVNLVLQTLGRLLCLSLMFGFIRTSRELNAPISYEC